MRRLRSPYLLALTALLSSCSNPPPRYDSPESATDFHTLSNPAQVRVRHIDLDLEPLFDRKVLKGSATLAIERTAAAAPLVLDTDRLVIQKVETANATGAFADAVFRLRPVAPVLGAALEITLPEQARRVRIQYETGAGAPGLQWHDPAQTAGGKAPFLYTQSQAIHARSWIPLQDSPGVRITFTARVRTPKGLVAVMSAEDNPLAAKEGGYELRMTQPIPSYLMALAVGDISFQPVGSRTGVYAERPIVARAVKEFEDMQKMLATAEEIAGPYRWGRYDVLVTAPSFPFGGMENPRVTFLSPAIIAGDKSLVALVAHEMAHSWAGNLVTFATWSDFWLSEGFTRYIERRMIEQVYGRRREEMEAALGRQSLASALSRLSPRDQALHPDLRERDPEAVFTNVPFEKGALFLRSLEEVFGRPAFDAFLRGYFDHFAFQSVTTAQFVEYLRNNLLNAHPDLAAKVPLEKWIYEPGLPATAPFPRSDAFAKVESQAAPWLQGRIPASQMQTAGWSTQEWLHFLQYLTPSPAPDRMRDLDQAFGFTRSGNAEILSQWLLMAIRSNYQDAYPRVEEFLSSIGRRSYLEPLYEELIKTTAGRARAMAIYKKARPTYHPTAQALVDQILGK
jgi:aminopeptidase N